MYIESIPNRNSPPAILLREAWREGKRNRKGTIANLSQWPFEEVDAIHGNPDDGHTLGQSIDQIRISNSNR